MTGSATLFSAELRHRRQAAGLSLGDLAAATHYSKGYLSKVETGIKPASIDVARRCDAALNAGGTLVALVAPRVTASPVDGEALDEGEVWMMAFDPGGGGQFTPVSRRHALAAGAGSLLEWRLGDSVSPVVMDDEAVARFGAVFAEIRALGLATSPVAVLPVVIAQTHTLRGLAASADEPTRQKLLLLAGRHAEYAGWMAQEAGDERAALWWTDAAVKFANAAGDKDLQAYSSVRKAGVLLYRNDATGVIDLARQAQRRSGVSRRIRGLAARREAQGHALAGDRDDCLRALDRAAELLDTSAKDASGTPPLGSTSTPNQHLLVTGWCLYDLGRPREGAEILDRAVADIPPTANRAAARFGARRALAHAAAGQIEHACSIASETITAAALIDSATIRSDLRQLARTLNRWHTNPAVRDLQPRLTKAHTGRSR